MTTQKHLNALMRTAGLDPSSTGTLWFDTPNRDGTLITICPSSPSSAVGGAWIVLSVFGSRLDQTLYDDAEMAVADARAIVDQIEQEMNR